MEEGAHVLSELGCPGPVQPFVAEVHQNPHKVPLPKKLWSGHLLSSDCPCSLFDVRNCEAWPLGGACEQSKRGSGHLSWIIEESVAVLEPEPIPCSHSCGKGWLKRQGLISHVYIQGSTGAIPCLFKSISFLYFIPAGVFHIKRKFKTTAFHHVAFNSDSPLITNQKTGGWYPELSPLSNSQAP